MFAMECCTMTKSMPPNTDVVRLSYNLADAGRALSVSVITLRRAIDHGLIRANKVGSDWRMPTAEVERVAAEGLPAIPHEYLRKTTGPSKGGRPRKVAPAQPAKPKGRKPRRSESRVQP
jgi:hypothetical protein